LLSEVEGSKTYIFKPETTISNAIKILTKRNIKGGILRDRGKYYLVSRGSISGYPITRLLVDIPLPEIPLFSSKTELSSAVEIMEKADYEYCMLKKGQEYRIISRCQLVNTMVNKYKGSLNRLYTIFDSLPAFVFAFMPESPYRIIYTNKKIKEVFGLEIPSHKNVKEMLKYINKYLSKDYSNSLEKVLRTGRHNELVLSLHPPGKTERWIQFTFLPIYISKTELMEWIVTCRNVTETKCEEIKRQIIGEIKALLLKKKPNEIFERIIDKLFNICAFELATLIIIRGDDVEFHNFYTSPEINKKIKDTSTQIFDLYKESKRYFSPFMKKVDKGEMIELDNISLLDNPFMNGLKGLGIDSSILLPLIVRKDLLAFFTLGFKESKISSRVFVDVLKEVTPFLSSVVENFILFEDLQEYNKNLEKIVAEKTYHLQVLYELSQKIGFELSYGGLFRIVLQYLHKIIDYDIAVSVLWVEPLVEIIVKTRLPLDKEERKRLKDYIIKNSRIGKLKKRMRHKLEMKFIKTHDYSGNNPHPALPFGSCFTLPLKIKNKVIGEIGVYAIRETRFTVEQKKLVETIVNQGAEAIQKLKIVIDTQMVQLRSLLEGLKEGILLLDEEEEIKYVNSSAKEFSNIIIMEDERVTHIGENKTAYYLNQLKDFDSLKEWEIDVDSPERHLLLTGMKILIGDKTLFIITLRDITNIKITERIIERQQRLSLIGQLVSGIAHDFNNLLTAIIGYSEYALSDIKDRNLSEEALKIILDQGKKASKLVSQLLSFSRKSVAKKELVNLEELISGIEKMGKRILPENIEFNVSLKKGLPNIVGDSALLETVIMNLVVNARDAMTKGGIITLIVDSCRIENEKIRIPNVTPGEYIKISIEDNGSGMDNKILERVFEPFFTTKPPGMGTGLGLFQVYGIVKAHNGYIYVNSVKGMGTSVFVYLPIPEKGEKIKIEEKMEKMPLGKGEWILVVEDNPSVMNSLFLTLKSLHYNVLKATNGIDAFNIFRENRDKIDLVLSDFVMPKMGGKDLFFKLKEEKKDIKVICMSGYGVEKELEELKKQGLGGFVQKPFTKKELAQKIREVIK